MFFYDDESIEIEILNNTFALDERCSTCWKETWGDWEERKKPRQVDENGVCKSCKGCGWIPTDIGEAIVRFLERQKLEKS